MDDSKWRRKATATNSDDGLTPGAYKVKSTGLKTGHHMGVAGRVGPSSAAPYNIVRAAWAQAEAFATYGYCSIFARSSTNFCWRSDWSLPSSDSACCVMFIEQNFGPHIEQNFASL